MRTLLGCLAGLFLAGSAAQADEMDREAKGKSDSPATAAMNVVAGTELDKESPDQSHGWRHRGWGGYRGGWSVGYGGWGGGWGNSWSVGYSSGWGRPYYGGGWGYSSFYRPYYGGWGYSSFARPYYGGWGYNVGYSQSYYGGCW